MARHPSETEERLAAEAKLKEEAKKKEEEAKKKAEEDARLKAEAEAKQKAETARIVSDQNIAISKAKADQEVAIENTNYRIKKAELEKQAVIKEKDESGAIVVFRSNNLEQWTFVSKLDSSHGTLGKMWECPDVFTLDGKQVIIISPQEVKGDSNNQLHDGNNSVYLTGEIDKEKFVFTRDRRPENDETVALLDYGIDFYAPETITTVDGRQVLIAWMNNWTSCNVPKGYEWSGQMTFPRELFFKKNWLYQKPVRELEKYRCNGRKNNNIVFVGKKYFDGVTGRHVEILLKIRNNSTEPNEESCRKDINEKKAHTLFTMNVAESKASRVTLCYDFILKELSFDRSQSGYGGDTLFVEKNHPIEKATMHVIPDEDTEISLHCLLDTCSLEVFVDGGKYSFANAFYALPDATDISFEANKEVSVDYEFYKIKV